MLGFGFPLLEPGMFEHLLEGQSFGRVFLQDGVKEALEFGRKLRRHLVVGFPYLDVRDGLGLVLEGCTAAVELVGEDADGPEVDSEVVAYFRVSHFAGEHLRWRVVESAALGFAVLAGRVLDGPAEVGELEDALREKMLTSLTSTFSGLMSRWMTFFECR